MECGENDVGLLPGGAVSADFQDVVHHALGLVDGTHEAVVVDGLANGARIRPGAAGLVPSLPM